MLLLNNVFRIILKMTDQHRWIRDDIQIDFSLPKELVYLTKELKRLDETEDYGYCNYSEALDYIARNCYNDGKITKKQWQILYQKYCSMF